jgi:hypothetical protein
MSADEHGRWDDALGAYLLGALPEDELPEFQSHLEGCERCREEAASLQVAVDVLAVAAPPVKPPRELKGRIMQVVDSEADLLAAAGSEADRPERRAESRKGLRRWFPRPVITAGATAAALALGVIAGVAIVGNDSGGGQRTLAAQVGAPSAHASLIVDGSQAKLRMRGMPDPGAGRVYEMWIKRGDRTPTPAGTFMLRSGETTVGGKVRDGDVVMVTSERMGGSQVPTRPPIVVAQPI